MVRLVPHLRTALVRGLRSLSLHIGLYPGGQRRSSRFLKLEELAEALDLCDQLLDALLRAGQVLIELFLGDGEGLLGILLNKKSLYHRRNHGSGREVRQTTLKYYRLPREAHS